MELSYVIVLYLSTVILISLLMYHYGLSFAGSFVVALIAGQILLNFVKPPSTMDSYKTTTDSWTAIYYTIQIGTPLIIALYAFGHAIFEKHTSTPDMTAILIKM